jgi:hypothetical protein
VCFLTTLLNDLAFAMDPRPSQWEPEALNPGENRPKSEANQSPPHNAVGQKAWRKNPQACVQSCEMFAVKDFVMRLAWFTKLVTS